MKSKEDQLQEACVKWFRLQYTNIVIFAIPNGGKRNVIEAAKLKATGTLAGVADLFVMKGVKESKGIKNIEGRFISNVINHPGFHGLFIELKIGANKQTPAQVAFEKKAFIYGYAYHVCRTFDEFKGVIENYLN